MVSKRIKKVIEIYEPELSIEPPEDIIFGYCAFCGGEIYDGETIYRIDGDYIHEDCLADFAKKYFADCKEELSVDSLGPQYAV